MRFALVPYGSLDPWREIALALVLAGHRVDVCWPDRVAEIAGERYDAVFTIYAVLPPVLRATTAPVVMVGWDAVFDEEPELRAAREAEPDRPLLYWLVCQATAAFVAANLPDIRSCFLPLPVHGDRYLHLAHGTTLDADSLGRHTVAVDEVLEELAGIFGRPDPAVVFLGRYDDPEAPLDLPTAMRGLPVDAIVKDGYRHFRTGGAATVTGFAEDQMRRYGLTMARDGAVVGGIYRLARKIVADVNRRPVVEALWRAFGDDFRLYGDEWQRIGLPGRPTLAEETHLRSLLYRRAGVSVDLGSTSLNTGWYARPIEIVKYGGRLLQRRRCDSDALFGALAPDLVCDSPASMVERTRAILAGEGADERAALRRRLMAPFDPRAIGRALAERVAAL